jgi:DNA (cytosine-5)-methyltransferase 1
MSFDVLDLFCCEGGAAEGYRQAGANRIVGVDWKRQRRYRYGFLRADITDLDVRFLRQFDLIHASPGCQFGTAMNNDKSRHRNMIPATRKLLQAAGVPYVIENVKKVADAGHLIDPVYLTGTMFGDHMITSTGRRYVLERTRCFETSWPLQAPTDPGAQGHPIANVIGGHIRCRDAEHRTGKGTGRTVDFPGENRPALAAQLMGMPWATMGGMSEAVPPSFTRYIGQQFARHLKQQEMAA